MMLTKRLLPGVLLACCFGALACSDEKETPKSTFDASVDDEPEDEDDSFEDEDDDSTRAKQPRDSGARRDGGADAGRDGGTRDAGRISSMDASVSRDGEEAGPQTGSRGGPSNSNGGDGNASNTGTTTTGPTITDTTRDPAPTAPTNQGSIGSAGGPLRDRSGNPAYFRAECPPALTTLSGQSARLKGCCTMGGICGLEPATLDFPNLCTTYERVKAWAAEAPANRTALVPDPTSCEYGSES